MDNIPKKFLSLSTNKDLRELFYEVSEVAIDCVLDEENLERIPIVSTLTKAGKFLLSFHDRIFIRNVGRFLREAENIGPSIVENYYADPGDEKIQLKTGEALLTMLGRIDDEEKAGMIGFLFTKRVRGDLSESWFRVMSNTIEKVYILDIHILRNGYKNQNILADQLGEIFVAHRIVDRKVKLVSSFNSVNEDSGKLGESNIKVEYSVSKIGKLFIQYINEYCRRKS